jgi:hypothetical protein
MSMSLQGAKMKISLARVLTLIILAVCAASSVHSTAAPFTLTLDAGEKAVKAGSELKTYVTLRNSSNRAIYMSVGSSDVDYAIEVRDSQGRLAPDTDFARKLKERAYYSNDTVFTLQPGESLPKTPLVATKFYDLSRPGKYLIQVSRGVPKEIGGGTVKSNTITIAVTE